MTKVDERKILKFIKGKIIIAFFLGVIALSGAWVISRLAFKEMLDNVKKLSNPNEKLDAVNDIFHQIINLNQQQRNDTINKSRQLQLSIENLRTLCKDNQVQVQLVDSIKKLLNERDEVLSKYLDVKKGLTSTSFLIKQIDSLESIIESPVLDSIVHTTEKKKITTTIHPANPQEIKQKGNALIRLWNSVFKKRETPFVVNKIVKEEINTKVDTLVHSTQDSLLKKAEMLIRSISTKQIIRNKNFLNKEAELAEIEKNFTNQLISILNTVEKEVINQTSASNMKARVVVNKSAEHISLLILAFLIITGILMYLIISDITKSNIYRVQLEQAKEEAEYHSLARQRFLSNMSHEIRTPLQSIIGFAEQAKKEIKESPATIEAIYQSSEHLLQIVNEILDYNRISSGNFSFEKRDFDLYQLTSEVIESLLPLANKKRIQLLLETPLSACNLVQGDPFRLKQILFNLIGNSIKFTSQGYVRLTVEVDDTNNSRYIFKIEDSGIGIPQDKISCIFNQFEQADTNISFKYGGTGLGLSIVKALVEEQNGEIEVTSEEGKGSVFKVTLSFPTAENQPSIQETSFSSLPFQYKKKIWVVDDDKMILRLCSIILSKYGIEHVCFNSARELLSTPLDASVGLIFTDIRMPDINGKELCMELKEKAGKEYKIIALTAQALPEEQEKIRSSGFEEILLKPFREADLISMIQRLAAKEQSEYKNSFSLEYLKSLTNDNTELLKEIIDQFLSDSYSDINLLRECLGKRNMEQASLILHRLAGRTSQIGNNELGIEFRKMELLLNTNNTQEETPLTINDLINKTDFFLTSLEQKKKAF